MIMWVLLGTTKGALVVEVLHRRVWLWDKRSPSARCWHLVVRREVNSPATIKYSFSNAAASASVTKLAKMQAERFWIERAFQDAKSHVAWRSIKRVNGSTGTVTWPW